jgi:hypothetical protein
VRACVAAAAGGHLNVLKFLDQHGCILDPRECSKAAAKHMHWKVVRYLDSIKSPPSPPLVSPSSSSPPHSPPPSQPPSPSPSSSPPASLLPSAS